MKTINNYPNYKVSREGKVYSYKSGAEKELKPREVSQSKKKYLQVSLYNKDCKRTHDGRKLPKQLYVHRLVWETYKGKIPKNKEIDHIDNNPRNNNLDNLQVISRSENQTRYVNSRWNGTNPKSRKKEIKELYKKLGNQKKVAEHIGFSLSSVNRVLRDVKQICIYKNGKKYYKEVPDDE